MPTWVEPKVDWSVRIVDGVYSGDYFEATDYQRIKNNLLVLKELSDSVNPESNIPDIPDVTTSSYGYASYINALERSLDALVRDKFNPGIPNRKIWSQNDYSPTYEDLNRIEGSCLMLYESLTAQINAIPRLAVMLGGIQFGK